MNAEQHPAGVVQLRFFTNLLLDQEAEVACVSEFLVEAHKIVPKLLIYLDEEKKPRTARDELLLRARFDRDRFGRIYRVLIQDEPPAPARESKTLTQLIQEHPDWTAEQVLSAIREARGSLVSTERNEHLRKIVDAHPDWSDSKILEALRIAGVRYGPEKKEELLQALPVVTLRGLLGDFSVKSAEFELRSLNSDPPSANLRWVLRVEVLDPARERGSYVMLVEPFKGRLFHLFWVRD